MNPVVVKEVSRVVFEGYLRTWEQEGGYASDAIEIDGVDLSSMMAQAFAISLLPSGDDTTRGYGRVRITIERI